MEEKIKTETATSEEFAEYAASSLRGAYNYTDLNRVGEAIDYIIGLFNGFGYNVSADTKVDWKKEDIPLPSDFVLYLECVRIIRGVLNVTENVPEVPSATGRFTFSEANDVEEIVRRVHDLIEQMVRAFRRSNAPYFWAGSEPLPTAESDIGRTWAQLDAMQTTWRNWQAADWYLLLYGALTDEMEVA